MPQFFRGFGFLWVGLLWCFSPFHPRLTHSQLKPKSFKMNAISFSPTVRFGYMIKMWLAQFYALVTLLVMHSVPNSYICGIWRFITLVDIDFERLRFSISGPYSRVQGLKRIPLIGSARETLEISTRKCIFVNTLLPTGDSDLTRQTNLQLWAVSFGE